MAGPSNTNTEFVMIDAILLDCYLCSQRLTAPIIQCRNGHYFCDSCNDGQYNKCPVCFKYICNNRCRAMERILDSARQCPNPSPNPNSRNRFSDRFRNRSIQPVPDLVYEISDDDDESANPAGDPNAEIWEEVQLDAVELLKLYEEKLNDVQNMSLFVQDLMEKGECTVELFQSFKKSMGNLHRMHEKLRRVISNGLQQRRSLGHKKHNQLEQANNEFMRINQKNSRILNGLVGNKANGPKPDIVLGKI
ncbi:hypothetical protein Bca52824_026894 [Brassica carinata]|uniref:RING-type domain-containing protein n=1 Tax=Brassica carinata TaxID=52824 RepID=A0A8X7VAD5_BRACI|nr:hypothetical protein Bca52824_026894 [Brassica carinata]